jgi:hypothetical protein
MWMPNVVLGGVGFFLLFRSAREKPLAAHWLNDLIVKGLQWMRRKK